MLDQPADTPKFTVADMRPHPGSRELDELIDRMTRLDYEERPAMRSVATDLEAWDRPRHGPSSTGSQSCALDTVRNDRRRSRNENVARPTSLLPKLRSARCTLNGDSE